ncbi:MAG TPA: ATP-binding protein [Thermoanaerobaculia bacterium]|jgi:predicted AAA+ superfamily ATPase
MIPADLLENQNPWWRDGAARRAREYPVRRDLQPRVLDQIQEAENRRALVLLGPRQVGKTVLLLQLADDLLDAGWPPQNLTYFDFSDERLTGGEAVTARDIVDHRPMGTDPSHPQAFLLDEIGSSPNWDRWLKQAVDSRIGRIVVTDSAASLLRQGSRESGQGRWNELYIEGLSFREFVRFHTSPDEGIEAPPRIEILYGRYLTLGGFPEYVLSLAVPEALRLLRSDIAERAVERDLGRLGLDVQRVKDLFVFIVRESGGEFNVEARASDLQADPRSVRDWVSRLGDTLLISPLERSISRSSAGLRARTKWFAADPGLVLAFARLSPEDREVQAAVFEAAVFRHLREVSREVDGRLSYFRHKDDLEIDFVFETADAPSIGIEVTSSQRLRPDKLARLLKAGKILKPGRLILVYGGLTEDWVEGVHVLPLQKFLLDPAAFLRSVR